MRVLALPRPAMRVLALPPRVLALPRPALPPSAHGGDGWRRRVKGAFGVASRFRCAQPLTRHRQPHGSFGSGQSRKDWSEQCFHCRAGLWLPGSAGDWATYSRSLGGSPLSCRSGLLNASRPTESAILPSPRHHQPELRGGQKHRAHHLIVQSSPIAPILSARTVGGVGSRVAEGHRGATRRRSALDAAPPTVATMARSGQCWSATKPNPPANQSRANQSQDRGRRTYKNFAHDSKGSPTKGVPLSFNLVDHRTRFEPVSRCCGWFRAPVDGRVDFDARRGVSDEQS